MTTSLHNLGRKQSPLVINKQMREILNHFGCCPECGYAAHAFLVTTTYVDGRTTISTVGSCGLPCGWSGPTEIRKMTNLGRF